VNFVPNATIAATMTILFTIFDTAIGRCAIVWGARGIAAVQLPEARHLKTRNRVLQRFPGARESMPPPGVAGARDALAGFLRGTPSDLASILLDMDTLPPFHRRVYEAARAIPWGATTTYGALATALGAAGSARAVGQALARNPYAIIVPCHRVVAAGGKLGGFSANGGVSLKLRLLAIEGLGGSQESQEKGGRGKSPPGLFGEPPVPARSRRYGSSL
jgi:O-6-methylguanine DNA methyltransferase